MMKTKTTTLWFAGVVVCLALVAGAAPAEAQMHCSQCTCTTSCSTACFYLERYNTPEGPEFEQVNTTCGGWGVCPGTSSCGPTCQALSCTSTINGTSGNDTINGTSDRECIYGFDGNDTIDGNAGDDHIYGGNGTDTLYGDSGNDCLWGDGGNDHLDGESGSSDYGDGGAGTDTCTSATEGQVSCP